MQIISIWDNLHKMLKHFYWEKYFNMSSAENFTKSAKH